MRSLSILCGLAIVIANHGTEAKPKEDEVPLEMRSTWGLAFESVDIDGSEDLEWDEVLVTFAMGHGANNCKRPSFKVSAQTSLNTARGIWSWIGKNSRDEKISKQEWNNFWNCDNTNCN